MEDAKRRDKVEGRHGHELGEKYTSYMNQLHEWQKICHFHYAICWQAHVGSMLHLGHVHMNNSTSTVGNGAAPANDDRFSGDQVSRPNGSRLECKPSRIWRRVFAELVDFLILMSLKMMGIIFYAKLTGESIESRSYLYFVGDLGDDDITVDDLRSLLLVGLLYRLLGCFYEASFLALGGATPGKMLLGLEVVSCRTCVAVQRGHQNLLIVQPGGVPSVTSSWIRSLIKNFSITFFMPTVLTVFLYQHNRTSYDLVADTIVVKVDGD